MLKCWVVIFLSCWSQVGTGWGMGGEVKLFLKKRFSNYVYKKSQKRFVLCLSQSTAEGMSHLRVQVWIGGHEWWMTHPFPCSKILGILGLHNTPCWIWSSLTWEFVARQKNSFSNCCVSTRKFVASSWVFLPPNKKHMIPTKICMELYGATIPLVSPRLPVVLQ